MIAGMLLLAGTCVLLGLVPGYAMRLLDRPTAELMGGLSVSAVVNARGPLVLAVGGAPQGLEATSISVTLVASVFLLLAVAVWMVRSWPRTMPRRLAPTWTCGKLFRKGTVQSDTASPFFHTVPVLVLAATLTAAAMLPVLYATTGLASLPFGDAILLVAFLALARFLCAIGALDAGGAFGGMGASREMTVGLLVEPALMMVVFSVAVADGTTELGELAARRHTLAAMAWQAPDLLAFFAMLILIPAETGRIPVDNPDTHLELTMLHEGMLLEHSGPGLACIALATHIKQIVILTMTVALFFPYGMAQGASPMEFLLALAAFVAKIFVLAVFLGVLESSYAKLRFFRVPQFLGLGLLCAFLALSLRIL